MIKHLYSILLVGFAMSMQMCTASLPENAVDVAEKPAISPDYSDLDIPVNIAPLNFNIEEQGEDYLTHFFTRDGAQMLVSGRTLDIDIDAWHALLKGAAGDTVYAQVYVGRGGRWQKYTPMAYHVAEEIDPYISYRHIEPLYMNYDVQRICQRNLENFDIDDIYNNSAFLGVEGDRQCINCHNYQDYNRGGNMQMHVRVNHGGTLIVRNGQVHKVNLKVGDIFTAGAYPSWHPTEALIAYSINDTWQHFHSVDVNKVEVQDAASGLILYDTDRNEVSMIQDLPTQLETFPYWSPDGKYLYYIGADVPLLDQKEMANYRQNNYRDIKYNIYRKSFDAATRRFGPTDTVFDATAISKSATFPRLRPDGRYMVFTLGEYGTFHNFHRDADLYMMDMDSGMVRPMGEINSDGVESYHSWSSNGRWLIFSTRRDNGAYTRLYLTRISDDGRASKPFILPERSPFTDRMMFRSYNVPEFMVCPVSVSRGQWLDAVNSDPIDATYVASATTGADGLTSATTQKK